MLFSHLTVKGIAKFDGKIRVILSGLEIYIAFLINKNVVSIDCIQFIIFSLVALVKNLSDNYFKHLSQELSGNLLKLIK